jgi:cell division protein FtsW
MTVVANPSPVSSGSSLRDRRREAYERLHGASPRPRRSMRRRGAPKRSGAVTADRTEPALGPAPAMFYVLAIVVGMFVVLGLVMVLSASAVTQANLGNSPYSVFGRQAAWAVLGAFGLLVAARTRPATWRRLVVPIGVLAVAAMALPFTPGVGSTVNGARSWVRVGEFSVQPSEFLKLAVVLAAADLLARHHGELGDRRRGAIPVALLAIVAAGASLAQGDLGSAVVLGAIVLAAAWIAGVPTVHLATIATVATVAGLLFVVSSARRLARFTAFMDVAGEKDELAYQTYQGYLSMASGGLTGSGIGGSRGKLGYLPYAHSDFIFAVIADELGFIGTTAVIGGFVVLIWFGLQSALAAPDRFTMILAGGITAWFGVQAIINLGGVTGLLPVTGLTLPFFSAGGSSLFVSMVAAGLLLGIARRRVRT